jgi:hypothetical protein
MLLKQKSPSQEGLLEKDITKRNHYLISPAK